MLDSRVQTPFLSGTCLTAVFRKVPKRECFPPLRTIRLAAGNNRAEGQLNIWKIQLENPSQILYGDLCGRIYSFTSDASSGEGILDGARVGRG